MSNNNDTFEAAVVVCRVASIYDDPVTAPTRKHIACVSTEECAVPGGTFSANLARYSGSVAYRVWEQCPMFPVPCIVVGATFLTLGDVEEDTGSPLEVVSAFTAVPRAAAGAATGLKIEGFELRPPPGVTGLELWGRLADGGGEFRVGRLQPHQALSAIQKTGVTPASPLFRFQ